jgi:hypothetical protein
MAGYSGTPLPRKLGIRPGVRVRLVKVPAEVRTELRADLAKCIVVRGIDGEVGFAMFFARSRAECGMGFRESEPRLAPAGMVWACWPKKGSGVETDLDENGVREIGLGAGLVDVKVCAVTTIWSGLKFVRRVADRGARG